MSRKPFRTALAAAVLALGGCVSTHAEWLGDPPATQPQRIPAGMVRVYQREADLPQGAEKVAVIWVEGESNSVSNRRLVDAAPQGRVPGRQRGGAGRFPRAVYRRAHSGRRAGRSAEPPDTGAGRAGARGLNGPRTHPLPRGPAGPRPGCT